MKSLPSLAGALGIALILSTPLAAQTPSGSGSAPASGSSTSPASSSASSGASNANAGTAVTPSAATTATAGGDAQAPSTVARPAVPTTSPVAPVRPSTASSTPTPAADVRATTEDPRADLTRPTTSGTSSTASTTSGRTTTATAGGAGESAVTDATNRDLGTSRRILGPGRAMDDPARASATTGRTSQALTEVPAVGVSSTATVAYLRAVEPSQRTAALNRVEAQLADTNRAINRLPQAPLTAPATAQVDYAAALQEVQARESQLRTSLTVAQQADEAEWAEARNRLAADYDAYIAATQRARAAAFNLDPTVAPAE